MFVAIPKRRCHLNVITNLTVEQQKMVEAVRMFLSRPGHKDEKDNRPPNILHVMSARNPEKEKEDQRVGFTTAIVSQFSSGVYYGQDPIVEELAKSNNTLWRVCNFRGRRGESIPNGADTNLHVIDREKMLELMVPYIVFGTHKFVIKTTFVGSREEYESAPPILGTECFKFPYSPTPIKSIYTNEQKEIVVLDPDVPPLEFAE